MLDNSYAITYSRPSTDLTVSPSPQLRSPSTTSDIVSTPTKRLFSPIRTSTASFPTTPKASFSTPIPTNPMHLIKIFQRIIFDRENTIALLTASNNTADTRITSLIIENEGLKNKVERLATQVKVLTQALQLQLEPSAVMNYRMLGKSESGTRRPFSFGGVGSTKLVGLSLDSGVVLTRVVESSVRLKSSSNSSPTSMLGASLVLAESAVIPVSESLESGASNAFTHVKKNTATYSKNLVVLKARKAAASKRDLRKVFCEYWW